MSLQLIFDQQHIASACLLGISIKRLTQHAGSLRQSPVWISGQCLHGIGKSVNLRLKFTLPCAHTTAIHLCIDSQVKSYYKKC